MFPSPQGNMPFPFPLWLSWLWVCMPMCLCVHVHEDWCSRDQTPTSCCVNPAPPVAQSGTDRAIHTSSVGMSLQGLSKALLHLTYSLLSHMSLMIVLAPYVLSFHVRQVTKAQHAKQTFHGETQRLVENLGSIIAHHGWYHAQGKETLCKGF